MLLDQKQTNLENATQTIFDILARINPPDEPVIISIQSDLKTEISQNPPIYFQVPHNTISYTVCNNQLAYIIDPGVCVLPSNQVSINGSTIRQVIRTHLGFTLVTDQSLYDTTPNFIADFDAPLTIDIVQTAIQGSTTYLLTSRRQLFELSTSKNGQITLTQCEEVSGVPIEQIASFETLALLIARNGAIYQKTLDSNTFVLSDYLSPELPPESIKQIFFIDSKLYFINQTANFSIDVQQNSLLIYKPAVNTISFLGPSFSPECMSAQFPSRTLGEIDYNSAYEYFLANPGFSFSYPQKKIADYSFIFPLITNTDYYNFWPGFIMFCLDNSLLPLFQLAFKNAPKYILKSILRTLNKHLIEAMDVFGIYNYHVNEVMHLISQIHSENPSFECELYYNDELSRRLKPRVELKKISRNHYSLFKEYSYMYNLASKHAFLNESADSLKTTTMRDHEEEQFIISLDRENILDSLLESTRMYRDKMDLMKLHLLIRFENEYGLDEGGVRREFFSITIEQLFKEENGLFIVKNNFHFFNAESENDELFYQTGLIFGLALYNNCFLNVDLPIGVYKMLLSADLSIEDLIEFDSELGESLVYMDDEDVSDLGITWEYNGVELKEGMRDVLVTEETKKEYVQTVIDWVLKKSIERQFRKFKEGFMVVSQYLPLQYLRAEELALMITGIRELDFEELKFVAQYEGYTQNSPPVVAFWNIVKSYDNEQKTKLLWFISGSPRAPVGGLGKLNLVISKDGDKTHIPSSHTCFYTLQLPDIEDEDVLRQRLDVALENAKGFGFM